ncbi:MAG: leucine-rich repeat protein [Mangrovibacterium sp.]
MRKLLFLLTMLIGSYFGAYSQDGYTLTAADVTITSTGVITACDLSAVAGTKIIIPAEFEIDGEVIEVTALGYQLFYQNKTLTEVVLPNTLKVIGEIAMREMTALTTVTIPASVEIIGAKAFNKSTKITSFTFEPNSALVSVGVYDGDPSYADWPTKHANSYYEVFSGLTCEITLPTDYPSLYSGATDWTNTTGGVVIAAGGNGDKVKMKCFTRDLTTAIPEFAPYEHTVTADEVTFANGVVTAYTGTASEVNFPAEFDGVAVTSLGAGAFANLTKIAIPASVERIEGDAYTGANAAILEVQFAANSRLVFVGGWAFGKGPASGVQIALPTDYPTDLVSSTPWVGVNGKYNDKDQIVIDGDRNYVYYRNIIKTGTYTATAADFVFDETNPTTILSNNLRGTILAENLVIPSSLGITNFGYMSFWATGFKNLIVPATVDTIAGGAIEFCSFQSVSFEDKSELRAVLAYGFANYIGAYDFTITLPTTCPDNHTATAWSVPTYTNASYTGASSRTITPNAYFTYNISYETAYATAPEAVTVYSYDTIGDVLPVLEDERNTFLGWAYEGTLVEDITTILPADADADITLVAQWEAKPVYTYTVTYDLAGYGSAIENTVFDNFTTAPALPVPTDEVMSFMGWVDGDGKKVDTLEGVFDGKTEDVTLALTATWENGYVLSASEVTITSTGVITACDLSAVSGTKIIIPAEFEIDGVVIEVTALGYQLFYQDKTLTEVVLPNTLKVIGEESMREMTALTTVTIPASMEIIGAKAFNKSTKITSFTFEPNSALVSVGVYDGDPSYAGWPTKHPNSYYEVFNGLTCEITLPSDYPSLYTGTIDWTNTTGGVVIAAGGNGDAVKKKSFTRELSATRPDVDPEEQVANGYVLTDGDVVVTDGVLVSYAYAGEDDAPTEITIPNTLNGQTVTSIGASAFLAKGLTGVVLPTTLRRIEGSAFKNNTNLANVKIPALVQFIGGGSFQGLSAEALASLTFAPKSALREIGNWAFGSVEYTITLPSDYPANADGATGWYQESQINNTGNGLDADQCYGAGERNSIFVRNVYFDGEYTLGAADVTIENNTLVAYNFGGAVHPANIVIPGIIGGEKVTTIADGAFKRKVLSQVKIGSGIARIESYAFKTNAFNGVAGAFAFETGSSLSFIGAYAFGWANVSMTLPTDFPAGADSASKWIRDNGKSRGNATTVVENDRSYSFYRAVRSAGDYTLTSADVTVEDGVITTYAYSGGVVRPYSVIIPETIDGITITGIGASALAYQGVGKLTIAATVQTIGASAFAFNALDEVVFAEGSALTFVDTYAFGFNYGTTNGTAPTTEVTLPTDYPALASNASSWLDDSFAEDGVIVEDDRAKSFSRNVSYEYDFTADDLIIEDGVIVGLNYEGTYKSFVIGDELGVTGIADDVFKDRGLIGIKFPTTLEFIGASAFEGNALYDVTIPVGVNTIGENAFANNAVTLKIELPTVQEGNPETDYYWVYQGTEVVEIAQYITPENWERAVERKMGERERNPGWTRDMEKLKRNIVAINTGSGIFVNWSLLGTDNKNVKFNLYRDGALLNTTPMDLTNYSDTEGTVDSEYQVKSVLAGVESTNEWLNSKAVKAWANQGLKMKLNRPADGVCQNGESYSYSPNDASVADLDGDGEYELVIKWEPSKFSTNMPGFSGNCIIDAYEFDGTEETAATQLWRIDLGQNVKAGSHYNAFMVYDLDCDGKAEVVMKTAPGSIDGKGNYVKRASTDPDYDAEYDEDPTRIYVGSDGTVNAGPEYLTLFDGKTGAELHTITYKPTRHPDTMSPTAEQQTEVWGDSWNNRGDRFLGAVAYLDGEKPSVIMTRGIYTRVCLAAYDVVDHKLVERWFHDSGSESDPNRLGSFAQGYHSLTVGDVDQDGRDEIVYGACVIDDDGSLLNTTGLGHGDALHMSDMDPDRRGLEVWGVHEGTGAAMGYNLWNPATGEAIFGKFTGTDNGRGLAADIDSNHRGYEMWSVHSQEVFDCKGNVIANFDFFGQGMINYRVYWDGDLQDELFNRNIINKWDSDTQKSGRYTTLYSINGGEGNNSTKYNSCLQADIFGDWREEIILRASTSSGTDDAVVIYSTIDATDYRMYTLMHDPQYRLAVAWQNVGYNQSPHLGVYLPDVVANLEMPDIITNGYNGQVNLTYAVSPEESGYITCDHESGSSFDEGTEVTLTYTLEGSYEFLGWYNNNQLVGTEPTLTVTLDVDYNLEARAERVYKLNFITNYEGEEEAGVFEVAKLKRDESISYTQAIENAIAEGNELENGAVLHLGDYVGLRFTPNLGFEFNGWYTPEGKRITERDSTFAAILTDSTFVARVTKLDMVAYSYGINRTDAGTVTSSIDYAGQDTVLVDGTQIDLYFDTNFGFEFGGWYVNDALASEDEDFTYTIRQDAHIEGVGLEKFQFSYESETEDAGVIYASHENNAMVAETRPVKVIYSLTNDLYEFAGWYVNDVLVSSKTTYEFEMEGAVNVVAKVSSRFDGLTEDDGEVIDVYPNPASDYIIVETPSETGVIKIYSAGGVLVKSQKLINSKTTIDVSDLTQGIYILHTADGRVKKLVIR